MKQCKKCLERLPLSSFYKNKMGKDGSRSNCKECVAKYHKLQYLRNTEKLNKRTLEYQRKNPTKRFGYDIKRKYGITLDQYKALVEKTPNCQICHNPNTNNRTKNKLCVDHCHKTGKVRGLLCDRCNKALGLLQDQITVLESAISYLKNA